MPTNQVTDAETRVEQYIAGAGYEFPTTGDLRALLALLATLREERDALLADKARLDILQDWLRGADYAYGELGEDQVLVFDLPAIRVSCDLRKTLDDARAAHQGTEP
jgi:hypothetical protein